MNGQIGRYQLLDEVARGGMGVVYRAQAPDGRAVAFKLLLAGKEATAAQRRRVATEIQSLLRLRHPHVVALLDAGEREGVPYLVMEWVDGESLAARVAREGPLDPRDAAELVGRLALAMDHCHARGVLHRDLKPDNVLLRAGTNEPLLTDFGLARDLTHYYLGNELQQIGRPEEALGAFDRAIALAPTYAAAYVNRGATRAALGRNEEALADLDRAIAMGARLAGTFLNRGTAHANLDQFEEALADFDRAIELDPSITLAHTNRGRACSGLGRHEEAAASFGEALRLSPQDAITWFNRAESYRELARWAEALTDYERAIELAPDAAWAAEARKARAEAAAQVDRAR